MTLDELRAMARKLATELDAYQPPTVAPPPSKPPAPTSKTVLEVAKGVNAQGDGPDIDKLKAMFPDAAKQAGKDQGFWANGSNMLRVFPDGRFWVVLGRKNWQRIPNAAIPLPRPLQAARLSYKVTFGPPGTAWHWGGSGKLPGLARHTQGRFPGGGSIGGGNFSNCPAWGNRGNEIGVGPYVYGQHRAAVPDQGWGPDYPDGTLRWGIPPVPGLKAGGQHLFEIEHRPAGSKTLVTWKVDGKQRWEQAMDLVAPGQPYQVTHVHFRVMYGGDTLENYWPPANVPVTVAEFADFKVEEI